MRPFVLVCTTLVAVANFPCLPVSKAQDWLREAIPLEDRTHDFGTVARSANTEHRFEIRNVHASDLHIRAVRASCGCTTPIVVDEWIKPGQVGTVLARFNTGTFTGRKSATLTVSIDKPIFTELQLNVKGYIRSDIVLNPGEINFGEVPVGEPKKLEVSLDYAGRSDWQITGIKNSNEFLAVDFEEVSRNNGRIQYKIVASLSELAPVGLFQQQLVLTTNDRNLTSVPVRISGEVQSAIQVSPQSFELGSVAAGETVQKRLVIKGREPFRVTKIESSEADIQFEESEQPKLAHLLNLNIIPQPPLNEAGNRRTGEINGYVHLTTDIADAPIRLGLNYHISDHAVPPVPAVAQSR